MVAAFTVIGIVSTLQQGLVCINPQKPDVGTAGEYTLATPNSQLPLILLHAAQSTEPQCSLDNRFSPGLLRVWYVLIYH